MRKFKTAADNRTNYIYYLDDASKCVITPGENGENTTIIAQLHAMDDEQVDADRREEYHCPVHQVCASSAFNAMWNGIKSTISSIYSTIKGGFDKAVGYIKRLAPAAFNWGKDIIMGIVNGIKSCIGAIGDSVSSVANKIRSFLHFSVPDEGSLTDFESWMPNFMNGLAKGIEKSKGVVAKAVEGVSRDMVISPNVRASSFAMEGASNVSYQNNANIVGAIREAFAGINVNNGDTLHDSIRLFTPIVHDVVETADRKKSAMTSSMCWTRGTLHSARIMQFQVVWNLTLTEDA